MAEWRKAQARPCEACRVRTMMIKAQREEIKALRAALENSLKSLKAEGKRLTAAAKVVREIETHFPEVMQDN